MDAPAPPTLDAILDAGRLDAVRASHLLDTPGEEPFDRLTRLAARILQTPYAFVTIVDDRRSFWKSCFGVDATDPAERQNTVQESFCQYVVGTGRPLVVGDARANPITHRNPSIESMGVRAWAGHPVTDSKGNVLGTFCAVDVVERRWTDEDDELLALLAGAASNEIILRMAADEAADEADRLRRSLLPPTLPTVPGLDIGAVHRAAGGRDDVLGDFYDVFRSSRGHWHVLLGDVCGNGVDAAAIAQLTRSAYNALADQVDDPDQIFPVVNAVLRRRSEGRFVTAQAASFEGMQRSGEVHIRFASAGHHPAVVLRREGGADPVEDNGWMLGAFDDLRVGATGLCLRPGDQLVTFTDGLIDCQSHSFDLESLLALLGELPPLGAQDLAQRLADEVAGADVATADDLAVLVVGVEGPVRVRTT